MFTSLLIPLDGSPVAELALPFAVAIAQRAGASLALVTVHRPYTLDDHHAQNAWMLKTDPKVEARVVDKEEAYLTEAAARTIVNTHVLTTTTVLSGSAVDAIAIANTILKHTERDNADLIVMTTRARGIVNRVGLGSVADALVRGSKTMILLIPSRHIHDAGAQTPALSNILIPVDGSALSEQILDPALALARLMGARCTLLQVVSPMSGTEAKADQYLNHIASSPRAQGLSVHTEVVVAKKPANAILEVAQSHGSDLIALVTHGSGGFKRLMLGSVADKLIQQAHLPILVRSPAPSA
jgi:nucleotide-binding universal stress UspA family protein